MYSKHRGNRRVKRERERERERRERERERERGGGGRGEGERGRGGEGERGRGGEVIDDGGRKMGVKERQKGRMAGGSDGRSEWCR